MHCMCLPEALEARIEKYIYYTTPHIYGNTCSTCYQDGKCMVGNTRTLYFRSRGRDDVLRPGQVIRVPGTRPVEYCTVISSRKQKLYDDIEDMMVWYNVAEVRPATLEESRALRAEDDKTARIQAIKQRVGEIHRWIQQNGEYPPGSNYVNGRRYFDSFDVHGAGEALVVDTRYVWSLINNGMDGDDWSRNNVVTGGAGAIGYRVPRKAELAEEIAELEAEYNRLTGA